MIKYSISAILLSSAIEVKKSALKDGHTIRRTRNTSSTVQRTARNEETPPSDPLACSSKFIQVKHLTDWYTPAR